MNGLSVLGKHELQFASQSRGYKQPKTVNYCLCYHILLTTARRRERHPGRGKIGSEREREGEGMVCENGHLEHQENNSNV